LQISSIVELVGLIICLHAAAKITHRAQGTGSVAAKWHSIVTCASDDTSQVEISSNCGSSEAANTGHLLCINYSESDLEAVDYVPVPTTTQLASYMSTYHKRQAFGMYLNQQSVLCTQIVVSFSLQLQMKIRFILVTNQFVLILSGGDPLILGLLHVAARLIMIENSIACTSKESLAM
jgi:hypothetical protein